MSNSVRFPQSMQLCGLNPNFTRDEWNIVMSFPRSVEIRELAYREWLVEQNPLYDNSSWRWYLSYLHGPSIIPLYKTNTLPTSQ